MLQNTRRVIAIELICAMQAVEYQGVEKMATSTRAFYNKARKVVASIRKDRVFSTDIERLTAWLKESGASEVMNQIGEVEDV